jgi:hypothetical protein
MFSNLIAAARQSEIAVGSAHESKRGGRLAIAGIAWPTAAPYLTTSQKSPTTATKLNVKTSVLT